MESVIQPPNSQLPGNQPPGNQPPGNQPPGNAAPNDQPSPREQRDSTPVPSAASAVLIGWLIAALVNALLIVATVRVSAATALTLQLYNLGYCGAFALLLAGAVGAWQRWVRRYRLGFIAIGSLALSWLVLPEDFTHFSKRYADVMDPDWLRALLVTATSSLLPIGIEVSRFLRRPWLRGLPIVAGISVIVANSIVLVGDYHGIHAYLVVLGASMIAAALPGVAWPGVGWPGTARPVRSRQRRLAVVVLQLVTAIVGGIALGVAPPAHASVNMARYGNFALARLVDDAREFFIADDGRKVSIPYEMKPWFVRRTGTPDVPPSEPTLLPKDAIVILLVVDSMRADLINSGKYDAKLPAFARVREQSSWFVHARAPGTQTVYTVAQMFAGTYFSQQYWTSYKKRPETPWEDDTVRFPQVLTDGGVETFNLLAISWLRDQVGVARGFDKHKHIKPTRSYYTHAEPLMAHLSSWLKKRREEASFVYLHLADPHAPYDLSKVRGSAFERYLGEVRMVDDEVGALLDLLNRPKLRDRAVLIVCSDHGEAFGEHGTQTHGTSLYDEQLRVPLLVMLPERRKRRIEAPVTLMDLGPTILDAFGYATPGHNMGQSLVPFLRGESPKLHRPILAETRMRQALVLPSGLKVIADNRANTVELYDLHEDPKEEHNLADDPEKLEQPLGLLREFFRVHALKKEGYTPPYRR